LSEVLYGIISPGTIGSIPVHSHDGSEGSGGTISGTGGGSSDVQSFLDLTDTPSSYDNGKYLRSTASGIEFSDVILTSSGSLQWRLNVSDDGTLYTTVV
jgi:hypothetical protein